MAYVRSTRGSQAGLPQPEPHMSRAAAREPIVVVIQDGKELGDALDGICECLGITVERISSYDDLAATLRLCRPMAVVAEMDAAGQDGCHVLITVAGYDQRLPVLLITGDDPALLGAIDAVEQVWHAKAVVKWPRLLGAGEIVNFLFHAGHTGNCLRLMPL
jgi:hypothetical protein